MAKPQYGLEDLSRDYIAIILCKFFRDKINTESINYTGRKVIQTIRDYDDLELHEKQYPVLKIFKLNEEVYYYEKFFKADYTIRYELLLPEMNDFVGLLPWVAKTISKYMFSTLTDESWLDLFQIDPKFPGQINYSITNSQTGQETKILDYKIKIVYSMETFNKILNN